MAGNDPLIPGRVCNRAREWTSLRLDGGLSPLEEELLDRHLGMCDACRAFEFDVRWATDALRMTPHERPSRRVTLPARQRPRVPLRRLTAVAAVVALALGALIGSVVERPSSPTPADDPPQVSLLTGAQREASEMRNLQRTRLPSPPPVPAPRSNPPEGVI